jgi:hypothetical protein
MIDTVDRAIIIGSFTKHYAFYTRDGKTKIAEGNFENDTEAEQWLKQRYPNQYSIGVEMRCYDD